MSNKIFVGNLSFTTTQDELSAFLSQAGEVVEVFLPTDRATGRPRGFAFVEFTTSERAAAAIERFDGAELGGRTLRLNLADSRPRRPSFAPAPGPPPGRRYGKSKGSRRGLRGKKRSL